MEESHLKSIGLNIDALETDLKRSVREEQRHWHENDAKLRAVEQKVATYDEFRSMVEGCELRPLKFKEVEEATKRYAGWSPLPTSSVSSAVRIPQPCGLSPARDFQIVRKSTPCLLNRSTLQNSCKFCSTFFSPYCAKEEVF
ncbi:unnamed protein product [Taenia asiatica]|uniref:Dynein_attach_N domain-containing protein n=1 Tax=Taenia asiatica TaxID=60517 RepID=A0A0R3W9M0_TAEAS|nr:unnamed protein product [Taenia asiatica]